MRRNTVGRCLFLTGVFLFLAVGLCQAGSGGEGKEGHYKVVLVFDKGKPVIGTNHVSVTVTDAASKPVVGARVKVDYSMPSLRGKPSMMASSTTASASKGAYEATLKLSMKGEWRLVISVATPARTEETAFTYIVE